jgi:hypothetical protein
MLIRPSTGETYPALDICRHVLAKNCVGSLHGNVDQVSASAYAPHQQLKQPLAQPESSLADR